MILQVKVKRLRPTISMSTITVTVIEVLPNNYLMVSGEKQLAMTQGTEYIRFSGVVRPENVINNTVSSMQVAMHA